MKVFVILFYAIYFPFCCSANLFPAAFSEIYMKIYRLLLLYFVLSFPIEEHNISTDRQMVYNILLMYLELLYEKP